MATESSRHDGFGEVSQLRGLLFEYLSLAASVVGILALAMLLVYVTIDAFGLQAADDRWFLGYFVALVAPAFGFLLYAAGDPRVTRRATLALGAGLVACFSLFQLVDVFGVTVSRLSWPLAYLFGVVVPVGSYLTVAAYQWPAGDTGIGLLARVAGGVGAAGAISALFVALDVYVWFLAFTLGFLPAAALFVVARVLGSRPLAYLSLPVGVVGVVAAAFLRQVMAVYPSTWLIYAVTLGCLAGVLAGGFTWRRRGGRIALAAGLGTVVGAIAVGFGANTVGIAGDSAVLLFVTVVVPIGVYVDRVLDSGSGRVGLLFPVLLVAGALAGGVLVDVLGATPPDPWLDYSFVTSAPSRTAAEAGLYPAIIGSMFVISLVAVLSFALGVGTAVFLEDYTPDTGPLATVTRLVQINISNLAGVPSVVYGLLGLGLFVNLLGLGFGTVVVASVTLSLLILPIVIISAQEAIRSVPDDMRQASYGLGATRWQTTKNVVLPEALPGILTGTILSLGRAIGETAPLIMIGAPTTVFSPPGGLFSRTSAMPMQIYAWADFPQEAFRYGVVAAGVVTLLVVLVGLNATAILVRNRYDRSDG